MPTSKQRISINLDDSEYTELSKLADRHKLSMAWIGRTAILEFLDRHRDQSFQLPLKFSDSAEPPKWVNEPEPR